MYLSRGVSLELAFEASSFGNTAGLEPASFKFTQKNLINFIKKLYCGHFAGDFPKFSEQLWIDCSCQSIKIN